MHEKREFTLVSSPAPTKFSSFLSGNDAITLLELIHKSLSCDSEDDFTGLFQRIQELFSFDFAHAMLGYCDNRNSIVTAYHVNISFPEEWLSEFLSRNYLQADTVVRENFTAYRPQYWSDTKKKINKLKEIVSLCKDFDMREGYTHGSRPLSTGKNGSMFSFSGPSMKYDKRTMNMLELVTPHLHLALSRIFDKKRSSINKIGLSHREKEVLDWLKHGKSTWDISVILGISERTVNFHVYNIMRKLGTTNRPQTVAVAAHLCLIDLG